MLSEKIIAPATTASTATILFVPDNDVSAQFSADYSLMSSDTIHHLWAALLIGKFTDGFEKATPFSTLDASAGYWQIEINERDRGKT